VSGFLSLASFLSVSVYLSSDFVSSAVDSGLIASCGFVTGVSSGLATGVSSADVDALSFSTVVCCTVVSKSFTSVSFDVDCLVSETFSVVSVGDVVLAAVGVLPEILRVLSPVQLFG
jgi:hypothetical protein